MPITPQSFNHQLDLITQAENFLIAYSGGVDSHVLLHLCATIKNSPRGSDKFFSAVYIDHGLSPHAKKWGLHCQNICYALDIPLSIVEVDAAPDSGQSPEAAARRVRYQALAEILQKDECLLTAQHLNDQAETLLLQLLRGSGTRGLAAMPRIKPFSRGFLCRPILDYRKKDILAYAAQHNLQWIEDESNYEERFDRNLLRHSIFPLLQKRWPAVLENFSRSAELQAESQSLLDIMAQKDMQASRECNQSGESVACRLFLKPLLELRSQGQGDARLKNVLRYWMAVNHVPLPSKKILQEVITSVLLSKEDANPRVCWNRDRFHGEVRKYREHIYLLHAPPESDHKQLTNQMLTLKHPVILGNKRGRIVLQPLTVIPISGAHEAEMKHAVLDGFDEQKLLSQPVSVVFRRGGERYRRSAHDISRPLKHWFQEQAIPPWERQSMPLIYWGKELIQVGHQVVNFTLISSASKNSLIIRWITDKELETHS